MIRHADSDESYMVCRKHYELYTGCPAANGILGPFQKHVQRMINSGCYKKIGIYLLPQ
jgi:hypothetical protein